MKIELICFPKDAEKVKKELLKLQGKMPLILKVVLGGED